MEMENETEGKAPKKSKRAKAKTQWQTHDKRTCKCAICLQHRGELRSSWYKHNRQTCACAVCKQARTKSWPKSLHRNSEKALAEQDSAWTPEICRPGKSPTPATHLEQERLHGNGVGSPDLVSHSFSVSWQTPDSGDTNREQSRIGPPSNNYRGLTLDDLNSLISYSMFSSKQPGTSCSTSQLRDLEQACQRSPVASETSQTYSFGQEGSMSFVEETSRSSSRTDSSPCPTSALLDSCDAYVDPYIDFQRRLDQNNSFWTVPSSPMTTPGPASATFCEMYNVPQLSPRDSSACAVSPLEREECSRPSAPDLFSAPPLPTDCQPESVSLLPSGPFDATSCASAFSFRLGLQPTETKSADVGDLSGAIDLCTTGSSLPSLQVLPSGGESLCETDFSSSQVMDVTPGNMMLEFCSGDQDNLEGNQIADGTEEDAGLLNRVTHVNVLHERESFPCTSGGHKPIVDGPELDDRTSASSMDEEKMRDITGSSPPSPHLLPEDTEFQSEKKLFVPHVADDTYGDIMVDCRGGDHQNMELSEIVYDTGDDAGISKRARTADSREERGDHEKIEASEIVYDTGDDAGISKRARTANSREERGDHEKMEASEIVYDTGDDAGVLKRGRTGDFREERGEDHQNMEAEFVHDTGDDAGVLKRARTADFREERDHQNMEENEIVHDTADDAVVLKRARTADFREEKESYCGRTGGCESNVVAPEASDRSSVSAIDGGKKRASGKKARQIPRWSRCIHSHSTTVIYSIKRRVVRKAGRREKSSKESVGVVGDGKVKHGNGKCSCSTEFCDKCRGEAGTGEKDGTMQSKSLEPVDTCGQLYESRKESAAQALQNSYCDRKSFPLDVEWPLQRPRKVPMPVSELKRQSAQQVRSIKSHGRIFTSPLRNDGVSGRGVLARHSATARASGRSGISPTSRCMELVAHAKTRKRIRGNAIVCLESSLFVPSRPTKRPRYDETKCASSFTCDLSALFRASRRTAIHSHQSAVKLTLDRSSWPVAVHHFKISSDTMQWEPSATCSTGMLLPRLRARSGRKYTRRTSRLLKIVYIVNFLWLIHRAIEDGLAHLFGIGTPADPLVDRRKEADCSKFHVSVTPLSVSSKDFKSITYILPVSAERWTRKSCERSGCSPQTVFSRKSEIFLWGLRLDVEPFRASTSVCVKSTFKSGLTNHPLLESCRPRRIRAASVYEGFLNRYEGLFSIRLTIPRGVSVPLQGCRGVSSYKNAEERACATFNAKHDEGVGAFTTKTEKLRDIQLTQKLDAICSTPAESDFGVAVREEEQHQLRIPDSTTLLDVCPPEHEADHGDAPAQTSQDPNFLTDSSAVQTTRGQSSPTDRTEVTHPQPSPAKCFQDLLRSVEVRSAGHCSLRSLRSNARNNQKSNQGSRQMASGDTSGSSLDSPLDAKMVKRCYAMNGHASNHGSNQIPSEDSCSSPESPLEVKTVKKVAPPPKYNLRSRVVPKLKESARPLSEHCSDRAKSSHQTSTPLISGSLAGRRVQNDCPRKRTVVEKAAEDLLVEDGCVDDELHTDSDEDCEIVQPPPTPLKLMREDFKRRLKEDLERPFSWGELDVLKKEASNRKPVLKLRETRRRALHVSTKVDGKSYLDGEPELERFIEHARNAREKLMYLRTFFFWIQNACTEGSFKPWAPPIENTRRTTNEDCIEVFPEEKSVRGGVANHTREKQYPGSNARQQSRTQPWNPHSGDKWGSKTPKEEDERKRKMFTEALPEKDERQWKRLTQETPPQQRTLSMTLRPRNQGPALNVKRTRKRKRATVPVSASARKPLLLRVKKELWAL